MKTHIFSLVWPVVVGRADILWGVSRGDIHRRYKVYYDDRGADDVTHLNSNLGKFLRWVAFFRRLNLLLLLVIVVINNRFLTTSLLPL